MDNLLSYISLASYLKANGVDNAYKIKNDRLCEELIKRPLKKQKLAQTPTPSPKKTPTPSPSPKRKVSVASTILSSSQETPNPLAYDGSNSCYIDSTIFALFLVNKKWLFKNILSKKEVHLSHPDVASIAHNIKTELNDLYKKKKSKPSCSRLRSLFHEFDQSYTRAYKVRIEPFDWLTTQQEPRDVINMLLRVFEIPEDIKGKVNEDNRMFFFNAPYISAADLQKRKIEFSNYFPVHDDKSAAKTVYEAGTVVVLNIERNFLETKITKELKFPAEVTMPNGSILHLVAAIKHSGARSSGGHYTTFYKDTKGQWKHYDDLGPKSTYIGSFEDMTNYQKKGILKNCTTLIYSKS